MIKSWFSSYLPKPGLILLTHKADGYRATSAHPAKAWTGVQNFYLAGILGLLFLLLPTAADARQKIGLVLGGGGAAGIAHVGVLKVLEENNIPIDAIAGNSMGAVVGSLYASGYSADELEKIVQELDWLSLFDDNQPRRTQPFHQKEQNSGFFQHFDFGVDKEGVKLPSGLIRGQKLIFQLRKLLAPTSGISDFDKLPIPFHAVATDLETGEMVVLDHGNLALAVRASMSIPGLFSPVRIGNHLLVDGFVSNNVPVQVARDMGVDILIVVAIPSFLKKKEDIRSAGDVGVQAMQLMMQRSSEPQLTKLNSQDILIRPGVKDIGGLDFDKVKETIPLGVAAAEQQLGRLRELAVPDARQQLSSSRATAPDKELLKISKIEIDNDSKLSDSTLERKLGFKEGDSVSPEQLQEGLEEIYGLGLFEVVDHTIQNDANGEKILKIEAQESSTGNNRLRVGMSLQDDLDGNSGYQFGLKYTRKAINSRGGELSVTGVVGDSLYFGADLYQPIDSLNRFYDISVWHSQRDYLNYSRGQKVAEVRGREYGFEFDIGKEFTDWGELRGGVFAHFVDPDIKIGTPTGLEDNYTSSGFDMSYRIDTRDDDQLPLQGSALSAEFRWGLEALGSDQDFQRLDLRAYHAIHRDRHRLLLNAEAGSTFDNNTIITEQLSLGGLGRLTGVPEDQLFGNHKALLSGAYMYQLGKVSMITKLYSGASLEFGNVWQEKDDVDLDSLRNSGSVFVGADTPLGPAFLGIGKTEGFDSQPFLSIGRSF